MARPKGRNGTPKRLYLNEAITKPAGKLAFSQNESLSDMVERLLARELKASGRVKDRATLDLIDRILASEFVAKNKIAA